MWFKILTQTGEPIDGSTERWSLPQGRFCGKPMNFQDQCARYILKDGTWRVAQYTKGTWLVNNPRPLFPLNGGRRIYVAQLLENPQLTSLGVIWVGKVRLIREATNLDLKRFGIHRAFGQMI